MALIELLDLSKCYRTARVAVQALQKVNLRIDRGDFVCVAGPSGSGKSTLLHLAGTLDSPTGGRVIINGRETGSLGRTAAALFRRRNIGFVFQRFNLIPVLTAFENVEYLLALLEVPDSERKTRAENTLAAVGLADVMHRRASDLSGGQQQRVAVARAIVANPLIILADEPTASLDSQTGLALIDLFSEINRRERTTFVFSSHDPRIIGRANRIVHLLDGEISREEHRHPPPHDTGRSEVAHRFPGIASLAILGIKSKQHRIALPVPQKHRRELPGAARPRSHPWLNCDNLPPSILYPVVVRTEL